jgi:hypothetical protein
MPAAQIRKKPTSEVSGQTKANAALLVSEAPTYFLIAAFAI